MFGCFTLLVIFICCTHKKDASVATRTDKEFAGSGFANIFISEKYLDASIERFEKNIHFYNNKVSKSVWFDSAAICFLADFIRKPENANKYDGFRFFMIQYDRMNPELQNVPGQFHPNQVSLAISPTIHHIADKKAFPEFFNNFKFPFSALNHGELCPNKCD